MYTSPQELLLEGWILKKRRKKMQGFAKRYFTLYQSGLLSYSMGPGRPPRDHVLLTRAAVSTAPGRNDIHIDSESATFHIKCLSTDDFNTWMAAFRKFVGTDAARRSASIRGTSRLGHAHRTAVVVEQMGETITELEDAFAALQPSKKDKKGHSSPKSKGEGHNHKNHKDAGVLGLFKKASPSNATPHQKNRQESPIDEKDSPRSPSLTPQMRIEEAFAALKLQHAVLVKQLLPHIDTALSTARGSPLPTTAEEDEADSAQFATRFSTALTRFSRSRASLAFTASDGASEFFDAADGLGEGGEEYVIDVPTPAEEEERGMSRQDSSATYADTSADTDTEDERDEEYVRKTLSQDTFTEVQQEHIVQRRTHLPVKAISDEGSLFAVFKNNVGKDLATIALPVTFNVPLTLLQQAAQEVEYNDLLREAAETSDPVERIGFVAAFAVSSYAHTRHMTGKKGFNPMLAETFEFEDRAHVRFVAEKVSHQPVVIAYHAEGPGWELYATSSGKTKFWGKSLEVVPLGTTHLKIGEDHFTWNKPSSFVRNLVMGSKYLEHCGKVTVENVTSGARCVIHFKENGYWGPANVVEGNIISADGEPLSRLEGKWDDQLALVLDSAHLRVLWRIAPFPKHAPDYYGFTHFAFGLNEPPPPPDAVAASGWAAPPATDSRRRPDVRALEEGDLNVAEAEKVRVEQAQRERRKRGEDRRPRWFREVDGEWVYAGGYWEERARGWKESAPEPLW